MAGQWHLRAAEIYPLPQVSAGLRRPPPTPLLPAGWLQGWAVPTCSGRPDGLALPRWQCVDWQLGPEPRNWTHLTQQLSGKLPVTLSVPLCPASVPTYLWRPPPSLTPALVAVAAQVELDAPKEDSWSLPAVLAATALLWL